MHHKAILADRVWMAGLCHHVLVCLGMMRNSAKQYTANSSKGLRSIQTCQGWNDWDDYSDRGDIREEHMPNTGFLVACIRLTDLPEVG